MAEEEKKEEEKEKKPKKGLPKGPIVIVLAIIIGLILAGVTAIIVTKMVAEKDEIPVSLIKPDEIEEDEKGEIHNFELGEFLAKIINPEEPTYVKVEKLTFSYDAKKYEFLVKELEERKPEMRDIVNTILISSTPEISTREGKNAFKKEIKEEINAIFRDGQIENVFCEIIVQ
ncbi:MAG: flagellar basal body-associated FliL family protein [bacterium]